MRHRFADWPALFCFFGLPALTIGFCAFRGFQISETGAGAFWGGLIGLIFLAIFITASGNDMTDFAVNSIIVLVLALLLAPVFHRAKENAQRQHVRRWIKTHGYVYPQPLKR